MAEPPGVCVADFEEDTLKILPPDNLKLLLGGPDEQQTHINNIEAVKRWHLRPRWMREVSQRSTSTSILGHFLSFPLCIAPTPALCLAHRGGELAMARASELTGTGFCLSTFATTSIEDISHKMHGGLIFLEVFFFKDKSVTRQLVHRAAKSGFKALVVNIEPPPLVEVLAGGKESPSLNFKNIDGKDMFEIQETSTWDDIRWLRSETHLPIIISGILTGSDAILAVHVGADGVLVSSVGSPNLKSAPSPIDMLDEVVQAVEGRCEVYLQCSIRNGTDIVKALALGAQAVFVDSAAVFGLTCKGQDGVHKVLYILKEEFDSAMALTGCNSPKVINRNNVIHESQYLSKL